MNALDHSKQLETYFATAVISQITPTDYHQNNASLFKLARLVKDYENAVGRAATRQELEFIFDRWCSVSERFWRPELTRDDYYAEFLEAYGYARIGLHENPIDVAFKRAKAAPLPQVQGFRGEPVRMLVAICCEMQVLTGDSPFFLPTRKLGELLGVHWTQVAHLLRGLEVLQIIHLAPGEVRQRGGNRSPRYHYSNRQRETQAFAVARRQTSSQPEFLTNGNRRDAARAQITAIQTH
jgi:hypothetical protein